MNKKKLTHEVPMPKSPLLRIITALKWKKLEGFDKNYYANPHDGFICSVLNNGKMKELKGTPNKHGYPTVKLKKDGEYKTQSVHRLIAKTFIDNLENKPYVHHIDHDRLNSQKKNLEWATPKENKNK